MAAAREVCGGELLRAHLAPEGLRGHHEMAREPSILAKARVALAMEVALEIVAAMPGGRGQRVRRVQRLVRVG